MKYIRTKDGVYEALESFKTPEGYFYFSYEQKTNDALNPIVRESVYDYDLIKQADNIKELCDDFVVCHSEVNDGLPFICPKRDGLLENMFKLWIYYKIFPYGAIWTDKGLIYVAKLNEKGNWELI